MHVIDVREPSKFDCLTNFISTVIGPTLTSCHVKLTLVKLTLETPLENSALLFHNYIPKYCSKTWLEKKVLKTSQNCLHSWNTECVKSRALEGGLIFRHSLAWDEVLQPACCFELKDTGFYLALVFTASLSEVKNGVKPCRISKTFWSIQTKLNCCIEDFKVWKIFQLMYLELRLPAWILYPE